MASHLRLVRLAVAALVAGTVACGDDGGTVTVDAGVDAATADAGPCGDDLFYQIEVYDWSTDISVPNSEIPAPTVSVTEIGNETNTTPVAPNGRAVLCLGRGTSHALRVTSTAHLPHIEVVEPRAYEDFLIAETTTAYRVYVFKQADIDGLTDGDGLAQNAHVLVNIQGDSGSFSAAIEASSDPALVGKPQGTFSAGTMTSATDTWIAFRNALVGTGDTGLAVTGALCSAPATIPLEAGTTTGVLASCFYGP